ncbi:hypothetical protein AB0I37_30095, partial [Micromonospora purpureochromogenes]|uniref:hypothetical protein n=1 Tax=Micromonospora purpureochromogenes TaxID=47872 RepID=UPI0033D699EA
AASLQSPPAPHRHRRQTAHHQVDQRPWAVHLGNALSGALTDDDGTWPSKPVRDVLEILRDTALDQHLAVAKMNQRGVTGRGFYDGGAPERALADQYSAAADRVRGRWPRSGALLDGLSRSYREDARREDRSAESEGDR